jgi:hypothetical protein
MQADSDSQAGGGVVHPYSVDASYAEPIPTSLVDQIQRYRQKTQSVWMNAGHPPEVTTQDYAARIALHDQLAENDTKRDSGYDWVEAEVRRVLEDILEKIYNDNGRGVNISNDSEGSDDGEDEDDDLEQLSIVSIVTNSDDDDSDSDARESARSVTSGTGDDSKPYYTCIRVTMVFPDDDHLCRVCRELPANTKKPSRAGRCDRCYAYFVKYEKERSISP